MSFDFREFKELRNRLVKMEKEWDEFLSKLLLEMGLRALTLTKENTPVDTGLLRNMWQLGDSKNVVRHNSNSGTSQKYFEDASRSKGATLNSVTRNGDTLLIEIYNPVEYASYIEYGHFQQPGRYVPAIGKKLKEPWVKGFFMATVAIDKIEREIPSRFEKQFKAWIKSLGVE